MVVNQIESTLTNDQWDQRLVRFSDQVFLFICFESIISNLVSKLSAMGHHLWLSLSFSFFSALFLLPYFTVHPYYWSFWLFLASYAFLDVGHSRTYRAKPLLHGIDSVLITGGSKGIGEEYAKLFARDGFNVILIARSKEELERVKQELLNINNSIRVHVFVKDLTNEGAVDQIYNELTTRDFQQNYRITHLINNAATGYTGEFLDTPFENHLETLRLNTQIMTQFCHLFGRYFREQRQRYPRDDFYILNMSSTASFVPAPNFAVYHATKSYIQSLSIALHEELKPYGIHVTSVCPGLTRTPLISKSGVSETFLPIVTPISQPDQAAKIGYRALFAQRRYAIVGYLNYLMSFAFMYMPYFIASRASQFMYSEREHVRAFQAFAKQGFLEQRQSASSSVS